MRCRIAEDEEPASARKKLESTLEEHVLDPEERSFIEPRLAHLLALEEGVAADRQDLFAAWRLFFERLSDSNPVVLAFEDMQWADASLLDFVEYLLEWSRDYPAVRGHARPAGAARAAPGLGRRPAQLQLAVPRASGPRNMELLLEGLVPGLPEPLRDQILARAQGVPLYAVETVRMLLDRGLLAQEGPVYAPAGSIETLEVPETLHALIAARLDGLAPEERRLLQDGAVLGKTFTLAAIAALAAVPEPSSSPCSRGSCARRCSGSSPIPARPRAGSTASCRTSSATWPTRRCPSASARLATWPPPPTSRRRGRRRRAGRGHRLPLHGRGRGAPAAEDADAIRAKAVEMLARAGERAGSLARPSMGSATTTRPQARRRRAGPRRR